jgi:phage tail-like protein
MSSPNRQAVIIDHVVDHYYRYPGETLTFYSRVQIQESIPGFSLRVTIPAGLTIGDYRPPPGYREPLPELQVEDEDRYFVWRVERQLQAGTTFEYRLETIVDRTEVELSLESQAAILQEGQILAVETVSVSILTTGQYMKYLPAIYHDDDFMRRFLMLFESFWSPIISQIDNLPYYFDPRTAPLDLLPWLASWNNLEFDDRWPEDRKRMLIGAAVALYKRRGTMAGLAEYLEMYTGVRPEITEYRSRNFHLGPEGVLGPAIALGRGNQPHTFSISLTLPPISPINGADEVEIERREAERRRTIIEIIEAEKPAHTNYTLHLVNT